MVLSINVLVVMTLLSVVSAVEFNSKVNTDVEKFMDGLSQVCGNIYPGDEHCAKSFVGIGSLVNAELEDSGLGGSYFTTSDSTMRVYVLKACQSEKDPVACVDRFIGVAGALVDRLKQEIFSHECPFDPELLKNLQGIVVYSSKITSMVNKIMLETGCSSNCKEVLDWASSIQSLADLTMNLYVQCYMGHTDFMGTFHSTILATDEEVSVVTNDEVKAFVKALEIMNNRMGVRDEEMVKTISLMAKLVEEQRISEVTRLMNDVSSAVKGYIEPLSKLSDKLPRVQISNTIDGLVQRFTIAKVMVEPKVNATLHRLCAQLRADKNSRPIIRVGVRKPNVTRPVLNGMLDAYNATFKEMAVALNPTHRFAFVRNISVEDLDSAMVNGVRVGRTIKKMQSVCFLVVTNCGEGDIDLNCRDDGIIPTTQSQGRVVEHTLTDFSGMAKDLGANIISCNTWADCIPLLFAELSSIERDQVFIQTQDPAVLIELRTRTDLHYKEDVALLDEVTFHVVVYKKGIVSNYVHVCPLTSDKYVVELYRGSELFANGAPIGAHRLLTVAHAATTISLKIGGFIQGCYLGQSYNLKLERLSMEHELAVFSTDDTFPHVVSVDYFDMGGLFSGGHVTVHGSLYGVPTVVTTVLGTIVIPSDFKGRSCYLGSYAGTRGLSGAPVIEDGSNKLIGLHSFGKEPTLLSRSAWSYIVPIYSQESWPIEEESYIDWYPKDFVEMVGAWFNGYSYHAVSPKVFDTLIAWFCAPEAQHIFVGFTILTMIVTTTYRYGYEYGVREVDGEVYMDSRLRDFAKAQEQNVLDRVKLDSGAMATFVRFVTNTFGAYKYWIFAVGITLALIYTENKSIGHHAMPNEYLAVATGFLTSSVTTIALIPVLICRSVGVSVYQGDLTYLMITLVCFAAVQAWFVIEWGIANGRVALIQHRNAINLDSTAVKLRMYGIVHELTKQRPILGIIENLLTAFAVCFVLSHFGARGGYHSIPIQEQTFDQMLMSWLPDLFALIFLGMFGVVLHKLNITHWKLISIIKHESVLIPSIKEILKEGLKSEVGDEHELKFIDPTRVDLRIIARADPKRLKVTIANMAKFLKGINMPEYVKGDKVTYEEWKVRHDAAKRKKSDASTVISNAKSLLDRGDWTVEQEEDVVRRAIALDDKSFDNDFLVSIRGKLSSTTVQQFIPATSPDGAVYNLLMFFSSLMFLQLTPLIYWTRSMVWGLMVNIIMSTFIVVLTEESKRYYIMQPFQLTTTLVNYHLKVANSLGMKVLKIPKGFTNMESVVKDLVPVVDSTRVCVTVHSVIVSAFIMAVMVIVVMRAQVGYHSPGMHNIVSTYVFFLPIFMLTYFLNHPYVLASWKKFQTLSVGKRSRLSKHDRKITAQLTKISVECVEAQVEEGDAPQPEPFTLPEDEFIRKGDVVCPADVDPLDFYSTNAGQTAVFDERCSTLLESPAISSLDHARTQLELAALTYCADEVISFRRSSPVCVDVEIGARMFGKFEQKNKGPKRGKGSKVKNPPVLGGMI